MRILIHGINYSPELTGIGKYTGEMAEWLAAQGHEVRVVTAPPYYPEWRISGGYSAWRYKRELINNVNIWRCPLWIPAKPSGVKRLVHLASFALSSLPVMLLQIFWKPDVVMVIEPPLMSASTALFAARLSGARSWLHVQDFEVDAAFDLGILPPGRMRSVVLGIERKLMRAFSLVSTISPNMLSTLHAKGVESEKAVLFPNWVNLDTIFPLENASSMRAELGVALGEVVALYSGNMGEKQGLEVVLDAARALEGNTQIRFVLCGDGAAKQRLRLAYSELVNVLWLPLQPLERLNDLLNLADIHLLPQRADVADLVMPSKLTGMLASARPVVATAYPGTQVAKVVQQCGEVCVPGDADALQVVIARLAANSELRKKLGIAAREYAQEHLGKNAVLSAFESELHKVGWKDRPNKI